jgi:hypothetical protein
MNEQRCEGDGEQQERRPAAEHSRARTRHRRLVDTRATTTDASTRTPISTATPRHSSGERRRTWTLLPRCCAAV